MAKLRKSKTKDGYVYWIDFYYQGTRHVRSTKTSEARTAKKILKDIEGKIARGNFNLEEYEKKQIYLSDFIKEYFKFAQTYKSSSTTDLEKNVFTTFSKFPNDINLRSIDGQVLDTWKSERLRNLSPATFNLELRTLKAIFNVAKRWGYLEVNPFNQISKLKVEERRLFMTDNELQLFFSTLADEQRTASKDSHRKNLLLSMQYYEFLLSTGLRRDEGLKLQKKNINYDQNIIFIEKTKDKETRLIPLTDRARDIIDSLDETLFSKLSASYVTHMFAKICKKANLTGFKLHSLRHTFATRLIDLGVDVLIVSKILGHSDIRTTMIYAKVRLEAMRNAVKLLEEGKVPVRFWLDGTGKG
jgi:integrase